MTELNTQFVSYLQNRGVPLKNQVLDCLSSLILQGEPLHITTAQNTFAGLKGVYQQFHELDCAFYELDCAVQRWSVEHLLFVTNQ